MKVKIERIVGPEYMTGALRTTAGKDMYTVKKPTLDTFKKMIVTAGGVPHSPLRAVNYRIYVEDVKSWVTVHYVRHHIGVQFYIKSQRTDRDNQDHSDRNKAPQDTLINMMFDINANSLLTMAQARLCHKASPDTRAVMRAIKSELLQGDEYDELVGMAMQPSCDWYHRCFEPRPCGKL